MIEISIPRVFAQSESCSLTYDGKFTVQGRVWEFGSPYAYCSFYGWNGDQITIKTDNADVPISLITPSSEAIKLTGESLSLSESGVYLIEFFFPVPDAASLSQLSTVSLELVSPGPDNGKLPMNGGSIVSGQTVEGSYLTEKERHKWEFAAHAGEVATISFEPSENYSMPRIVLVSPSGIKIANDDYSPGLNLGPIPLPESGKYTILPDSFCLNCSISAEYKLSLKLEAPDASQPIEYGQAQSASLDLAHIQVWSFDGQQGDKIGVSVNSSNFNTVLYVFSPKGEQIGFNNDYDGTNSKISSLALPETGQYLVMVRSFLANEAGQYMIDIQTYEPTATTSDSTLPIEKTFDLKASEIQLIEFNGKANQSVRVNISSTDIICAAQVLQPNSEVIANLGGYGVGTAHALALPVEGTYTVRVGNIDQSQIPGHCTITIEEPTVREPGLLKYNEMAVAKIDFGEKQEWTFEAFEGQSILVQTVEITDDPNGGAPFFKISGSNIGRYTDNQTGFDYYKITKSGTYTVEVELQFGAPAPSLYGIMVLLHSPQQS